MSGGSVYDYLHKQKGVFKFPSLLKVAIDVSKGMNYLHQNDIVHRDLKAANLLMGENSVWIPPTLLLWWSNLLLCLLWSICVLNKTNSISQACLSDGSACILSRWSRLLILGLLEWNLKLELWQQKLEHIDGWLPRYLIFS